MSSLLESTQGPIHHQTKPHISPSLSPSAVHRIPAKKEERKTERPLHMSKQSPIHSRVIIIHGPEKKEEKNIAQAPTLMRPPVRPSSPFFLSLSLSLSHVAFCHGTCSAALREIQKGSAASIYLLHRKRAQEGQASSGQRMRQGSYTEICSSHRTAALSQLQVVPATCRGTGQINGYTSWISFVDVAPVCQNASAMVHHASQSENIALFRAFTMGNNQSTSSLGSFIQ